MLALALLAGCPSLLQSHDSGSEARRALEVLGQQGLSFEVAHQPVVLKRIELSEIAVDGQDPPSLLFHLVATGTFGAAQLGYYGSEHVSFRRKGGHLLPPELWLPKLQGVLMALTDGDATPIRDRNVISIRIDGDTAALSVTSEAGATRTASLIKRGDSWHFLSGLL